MWEFSAFVLMMVCVCITRTESCTTSIMYNRRVRPLRNWLSNAFLVANEWNHVLDDGGGNSVHNLSNKWVCTNQNVSNSMCISGPYGINGWYILLLFLNEKRCELKLPMTRVVGVSISSVPAFFVDIQMEKRLLNSSVRIMNIQIVNRVK